VDTATGEVAGYELLSRFPECWGVSPQGVFDAAASHGVSPQLTRTVLLEAVALRDTLPPRTFLTVNCSPADLTSPLVLDVLAGSDLSRVFVELTESAWPEDQQSVLRATDVIRRQGGRIASDDVGAGYAGLLQLIRLRPDLVKVDRAIVERIEDDPAAVALISMLGDLVGRMDGWLVAEGVETFGQLATVVDLGVPLVQGFYLARPAEPWSGTSHQQEILDLNHRVTLREHLVAYRRDAGPDELLVDERGGIEGVRVPLEGGRFAVTRPLVMAPSTTVTEAVLRAMARPTPLERIAPVVLTDTSGHQLGVVPVERLVEALTQVE
jgi:EAL domain-containing protein (putative c-di-GMP-specific phosphodiesterase class I)